jgi:hypothetical protein
MVAAAGTYTFVVVYPAAYPRVMSIGATDDRDEVPWWVPRLGPIDLHAPGDAVPVAERFASYGVMTGTSSATPHVAATAGLLLGQNPGLTAGESRRILVTSADTKGRLLNRFQRLNAHRAMLRAESPPNSPIDPPHESCQLLPLSAARRAAVDRLLDEAHPSLRRTLHRHRIQVGALVTANPGLARLVIDVARAGRPTPAATRALRGFLRALSALGSADLQADLQPTMRVQQGP